MREPGGPSDVHLGRNLGGTALAEFYSCLTARGDELFELTDAVLCADGPVTSPVDLTLLSP